MEGIYLGPLLLTDKSHQGVLYLASPITLFLLQRWPHIFRINILLGLGVAVIGTLASSFATKVWHLILTQGIVYPIGASMLYYPVLIFIDEWFVRRKGLAYGVAWVGSSHVQKVKKEVELTRCRPGAVSLEQCSHSCFAGRSRDFPSRSPCGPGRSE